MDLEPGEDVKFTDPADVGGNYEAFERQTLLRIGAGLGMPYDMLTGDLSQTSYSSIRAGILSFRRLCEQVQYGVFIFQFCRPVWQAFIEAAVLAGELDARDYQANRADYLAVEWHTPKWAWVDPEKDVKAEIMAIRAGLKSRSMAINETGKDEEEVDQQIAKDNERADELELVLDSDPRRTDLRGAEKVEATSPEDDGDRAARRARNRKAAGEAARQEAHEKGVGQVKQNYLPHLAARVFGVPLMVQIDKLMVILDAIGPRIGLREHVVVDGLPVAVTRPAPDDEDEDDDLPLALAGSRTR